MQDRLESTMNAFVACTNHGWNQVAVVAVGTSPHKKQDIGRTQELHLSMLYQKASLPLSQSFVQMMTQQSMHSIATLGGTQHCTCSSSTTSITRDKTQVVLTTFKCIQHFTMQNNYTNNIEYYSYRYCATSHLSYILMCINTFWTSQHPTFNT